MRLHHSPIAFTVLTLLVGCGSSGPSGGGHEGSGGAGRGGAGGTSTGGRGGIGGGSAGSSGTGGNGGSAGAAGAGGSAASGGATAGASGSGGAAGAAGAGGSDTTGTAGSEGGAGAGGSSTAGEGGGGSSGGAGAGGAVACTPADPDGGTDAGGTKPDDFLFLQNVTVTTLAGGATAGTDSGPLGTGTLSNPVSVTIEPEGSLIVTDFDSNRLRRVTSTGTLSTVTTSTMTSEGSFTRPFGLGWIGTTLYAQTDADPTGMRGPTGGTIWSIDRNTGLATVVLANVGRPRAFAALSDGRLVLSDFVNTEILLLNVTTKAVTELAGQANCSGSSNGTGSSARFSSPQGVVVLPGDRIIVADRDAHILREVSLAGGVTTFAGDGVEGLIDGPKLSARFSAPSALAADASGAVYVSDTTAHRIRRIAANGTVTTVAGNGTAGFMDGPGNMAEFYGAEGIAVTADGSTIYVADGTGGSDDPVPYNRLRKITIAP